MKNSSTTVAKYAVAIAAIAAPILIFAYAEGPDAGLAGVPGEASCTSCHGGGSGSGSVSITFANGLTYTPGVKQHLQVVVTDSAQKRWGYELTARLSSSTSTQAGVFAPSDGNSQLVCTQAAFRTEAFGASCSNTSSYPLQYITQTGTGTRNGTKGSVTFALDWTPPASATSNITIYVAANAANGDGGTGGDHIYLKNYTLTPAVTTPTPTISSGGVVNGAGFQPAIASGSWVTINGSNLANSTGTWSNVANGLPSTVNGVSVTIDNKPAYVYYVSPTQLNVLAPPDTSTGSVSVVVTNNGVTSKAGTALLLPQSPALFLWNNKYAVATRQDYSLVGPTTPAKAGDVLILWATGLGATTPSAPAGQITPSDQLYSVVNPPTVTIGGVNATIYAAALASGFAGLYQLAIQVPPTVGSGDQPVVLQTGSVMSPSGVYLTIQ